MKRESIRVCVLRVGGTNCDSETKRSLQEVGVKAEIVNANELFRQRNMLDYDALVFPGGFSYGDYVRAGAIWAKWIVARLGKELQAFVSENRPILGICNGFQVLVEAGLLPGFEGISENPEAALATNIPPGYNCRWIYLKHENRGKCVFTSKARKGQIIRVPVAHGEGRFMFESNKSQRYLRMLLENDQLVFRYSKESGEYADEGYPTNPNGSFYDIAGICNPEGTVFGLMPHPERAFYSWQQPDWTRMEGDSKFCDGKLIFESLADHLERKR